MNETEKKNKTDHRTSSNEKIEDEIDLEAYYLRRDEETVSLEYVLSRLDDSESTNQQ